MEVKHNFTNTPTKFAQGKQPWSQARRSKIPPAAKDISSVPNALNSYKPTRNLAQKPKQPTNANREYLSPGNSSQLSPNGPTQAIVNANSMTAQLSKHLRAYIVGQLW